MFQPALCGGLPTACMHAAAVCTCTVNIDNSILVSPTCQIHFFYIVSIPHRVCRESSSHHHLFKSHMSSFTRQLHPSLHIISICSPFFPGTCDSAVLRYSALSLVSGHGHTGKSNQCQLKLHRFAGFGTAQCKELQRDSGTT